MDVTYGVEKIRCKLMVALQAAVELLASRGSSNDSEMRGWEQQHDAAQQLHQIEM